MKIKFLIVDDSAVMRKMIIQAIYKGNIFNEENTEMFQAGNGAQGVEMFTNFQPQIVLSDWNMPVMDGLEMVKKIRDIDKKVPIIMITTEGTEDKMNEALQQGLATYYLVKPLKPGSLEEKLTKAFQALKAGL